MDTAITTIAAPATVDTATATGAATVSSSADPATGETRSADGLEDQLRRLVHLGTVRSVVVGQRAGSRFDSVAGGTERP